MIDCQHLFHIRLKIVEARTSVSISSAEFKLGPLILNVSLTFRSNDWLHGAYVNTPGALVEVQRVVLGPLIELSSDAFQGYPVNHAFICSLADPLADRFGVTRLMTE